MIWIAYGRHLGTCRIAGEDVSRLLRAGWALAAYVANEDRARVKMRGLWAGTFIAPWDWRHRGPRTVILGAVAVPEFLRGKLSLYNLSSVTLSHDTLSHHRQLGTS